MSGVVEVNYSLIFVTSEVPVENPKGKLISRFKKIVYLNFPVVTWQPRLECRVHFFDKKL